jgi:hypothetical protein
MKEFLGGFWREYGCIFIAGACLDLVFTCVGHIYRYLPREKFGDYLYDPSLLPVWTYFLGMLLALFIFYRLLISWNVRKESNPPRPRR